LNGLLGPKTRRLRRIAFWGFAVILFTATHWPALQLPGPPNTDKFVHIAAFGCWTMLLILAAFFGGPFRWRNILACLIIAPIYAAIDEYSQAIPFIKRSAEFADYFANLKGIGLAGIIAIVLMVLTAPSGSLSSPQP